MPRTIIHVDMDAFFSSIEQRDNPALIGKCVVVGGSGDSLKRGVVSTASYEARVFGVHSALPLRTARKLCPHAIFLPVDMEKYHRVSMEIMSILSGFTDQIEQVSVDEAFLDVSNCRLLFGTGPFIARRIKRRIKQKLSLTASVGVAPNKFLAKLASDLKKPDGLVVITDKNIKKVVNDLPVTRLWGVGKKTQAVLKGLACETIGQLAEMPVDMLKGALGKHGEDLKELANGRDDRPVITYEDAKSIGNETTFQEDIGDVDALKDVLMELAEQVARRLRKEGVAGRTITLKLRYSDFKTITRSHTINEATNLEIQIYKTAEGLLSKPDLSGKKVRLLGVSASNLSGGPEQRQLSLFDSENTKLTAVSSAMDKIKDRFGEDIITHGRLADKPKHRS